MLTSINIVNALATVSANIDGSLATQDNAVLATGYSNGSAFVNLGTASVTADFAASGSVAYDTANNHVHVADGSYATCTENGINFAIVAQGNAGGTLDLNGAGLSFTPDIGDGRLGVSVAKNGATFDVSLDGTGTINFGTNGIITIPKDFSLNFAANLHGRSDCGHDLRRRRQRHSSHAGQRHANCFDDQRSCRRKLESRRLGCVKQRDVKRLACP